MPDYEHVDVDSLPDAPNPTRRKKEVDEAVGAEAFGFNVYVADPGERIPWGYHRHPDHEELFYVVSGRLEVETDDGTIDVGTGEAFYVPADAGNLARAAGKNAAHVIAVGAPKTADGAVLEEPCEICGEATDRNFTVDDDAYVLTCTNCGERTDRLTPGPDEVVE